MEMDPSKKNMYKTEKVKCSILLQMGDKMKERVINFSLSFPQKGYGFPQCLRMWKTHYARITPHEVFHINDFFQAKSGLFLWKTMWKVWKSLLETTA